MQKFSYETNFLWFSEFLWNSHELKAELYGLTESTCTFNYFDYAVNVSRDGLLLSKKHLTKSIQLKFLIEFTVVTEGER